MRGFQRLGHLPVRRDVAIHVIDQRGVERLLPFEEGRDHGPRVGAHTSQPAASLLWLERQELPPFVERRDLELVVRGWRMWKVPGLLNRGVEFRQRVVVQAIGLVALALQPRELVRASLVSRHADRNVLSISLLHVSGYDSSSTYGEAGKPASSGALRPELRRCFRAVGKEVRGKPRAVCSLGSGAIDARSITVR